MIWTWALSPIAVLWMVDWSLWEWLWYSYDFDAWLQSCVEATIELGRKRVIDGAVLVYRKLLEVVVIFEQCELMSLWGAKSQVRQMLVARYPANPEESLAVALKEYPVLTCSLGTSNVNVIGTWPT